MGVARKQEGNGDKMKCRHENPLCCDGWFIRAHRILGRRWFLPQPHHIHNHVHPPITNLPLFAVNSVVTVTWHHWFSHREYLLDNFGVSTRTIVVRLFENNYYVSNIYNFVMLPFWFQYFDSKYENVLQSSNSLNNKRNFGTLTPGHYCNVSHQYLTMAVNSSQPSVYCVIIIF